MQSYQLFIALSQATEIQIGRLGLFKFPKGTYVYTGSAKRSIDERIARHLSKDKNLHWHIDYLLANDQAKIIKVIQSEFEECVLNAGTKGGIIVKGFGSSDCKEGCKSHLIFLEGTLEEAADIIGC
jgi:Uri superfamily endonuclease